MLSNALPTIGDNWLILMGTDLSLELATSLFCLIGQFSGLFSIHVQFWGGCINCKVTTTLSNTLWASGYFSDCQSIRFKFLALRQPVWLLHCGGTFVSGLDRATSALVNTVIIPISGGYGGPGCSMVQQMSFNGYTSLYEWSLNKRYISSNKEIKITFGKFFSAPAECHWIAKNPIGYFLHEVWRPCCFLFGCLSF